MRREDGRGGYRAPRDRAPRASGVGRNSRRTDNQPINVPNVSESTDLQQGDRQRLEAAMQTQPLGRTPAPNVGSAPSATPLVAGGGRGALPEHLMASPSNRPGEPLTEGLPFGPGAGPEALTPAPVDPQQEILHKLYAEFGDDWALDMLNEMQAPPEVSATPGLPELAPEAVVEEAEPEPTELPFPEEVSEDREVAEGTTERPGGSEQDTDQGVPIEAVPAEEGGEPSQS